MSLEDKMAELERPVSAMLAKGAGFSPQRHGWNGRRLHKRMLSTEGADTTQSFTYGGCGMAVIAKGDDGHTQRRSYPTWQGGDGFQGGYEARETARSHGAHRSDLRRSHRSSDSPARMPRGAARRDPRIEPDGAPDPRRSCGHPAELDRVLGTEISLAGRIVQLQAGLLGKLRYGSAQG